MKHAYAPVGALVGALLPANAVASCLGPGHAHMILLISQRIQDPREALARMGGFHPHVDRRGSPTDSYSCLPTRGHGAGVRGHGVAVRRAPPHVPPTPAHCC